MVSDGVRSDSPLAAIGTVELFDFDNGLIGANYLERSVRGVRLSSSGHPLRFTYVGIQLERLGKRSTIYLVVK